MQSITPISLIPMVRNYLKIALRNLRTHTVYSFINLFGLAVGVASCLLIVLFVKDEQAYDRFLPADRYRMVDICTGGRFGNSNRLCNGFIPKHQGGFDEPGEFVEK